MTRSKSRWPALILLAMLTGLLALAALATRLPRLALWHVVRVCVADAGLLGVPFPCRQADLAGGKEQGSVVVQPPLLNDMIVVPTRPLVGVEDAFLQTPEAPNYFAAAWRARSLLVSPSGRRPEWDEVALVVNPAMVRTQDQLHIHVGCLFPRARIALAAAAPQVPVGAWVRLPEIVPHIAFWGTRVGTSSLSGVAPFRLAAEALADRVRERGKLTLMVAGVRVAGAEQFLIVASYAGAPHSWWPIGNQELIDARCPP
ncbi:CDP-diacylglycerol diphosphatase [uncultured Rhodoblastus sp.]|uniref:CDP-diacylglycerol diphosphatase n=1 Tax=uncultured Rhodoblastus sp. TaxID=543037 RepID=UPI0025F640E6|nr:CDP-diacylglycerol diphosphatase [uncultured Rhodoblastus sp.]